ncbi:uncharacterized protein LOC122828679 isoform X1 [Gambusia affinis]|uniref:uncharacterized protein LOC122828679 isoform X1 n=1 Tax=Gambusia affinis TaxID=33528 RepID=UPI001CDC7B5F|nr:uncharacterized protein LOC122828679 isoform X1 [Gambusia affinis]
MSFSLEDFVQAPSHEQLELCRKDDLLCLAEHFDISVKKHFSKAEIKNIVVQKLVEIKVLGDPSKMDVDVCDVPSVDLGRPPSKDEGVAVLATPPRGLAEPQAPPATLPRFDPVSPELSGSGGNVRLKVRLARLQLEAQERELIRKAEFDFKLEMRKLEIEAEKEIKLKQLEVEAMRLSHGTSPPRSSVYSDSPQVVSDKHKFDVSKNIALVPVFRESEVDSYFSAFERIAVALEWPKEMWAVLMQCKLIGKAQEVVSSLSTEEGMKYEVLKKSILRAYELVPEAYRQKFRNHKRSSGQTYVEFAREKGLLFDKWCAASEVKGDFESLRQLILLEDFKNTLPERLVVFLNEQKVASLSKAAIVADEFMLTHKNVFVSVPRADKVLNIRQQKPDPTQSEAKAKQQSLSPREVRECFYCHKKGHVIADCLSLKSKALTTQTKGVGLLKNVSNSSNQTTKNENELDPCFIPFVTQGLVSLTGDPKDGRQVKILRDTGGSQTIIREGILSLPVMSSCQSRVVVQGIGMTFVSAPLHNIHLDSSLVSGFCRVAVLPTLPIKGIDLILGNDLAGGKVLPVPEVLDTPDTSVVFEPMPNIFPACVVTRAQSKKYNLDLSDSFLATEQTQSAGSETELNKSKNVFPLPGPEMMKLPASREEFIAAQKQDKTLLKCHSSVLTQEEAQGKKVAYMVDDGLLLRRWAGENLEDWSTVYQVVVPTRYRMQVLALAHDHPLSGHLGINKMYNKVLKHFFWPGLKSDVSLYCRTCHVCQVAGKPNQVIPPAPLSPIPVVGEPFGRVIVDCVGPLPKSRSGNQFILTIMCASTRFPEAVPLRRITAPMITKALVKFFSVFGLPKVVQTDQGTNFMSRTFAQALKQLGVEHVTSSSYHPESQGALERFHQTLKAMLRKYCMGTEKDWDEGIPFLLFAVRGTVQDTLGCSPAGLVFGHEVRGPLNVLKDQLISSSHSVKSIPEYVSKMRERLQTACALAQKALASKQVKMKRHYDQKAVTREFNPGDKVLILLPIPGSSLETKFSGPYVVEKKLSETNYIVQTPDRRKTRLCHVNMIKLYHSRETDQPTQNRVKPISPVTCVTKSAEEDMVTRKDPPQVARLSNSEILANLPDYLSHLSGDQVEDITKLISDFQCLFGDVPTKTNVVSHDIVLSNPAPIKQRAYRVNATKRELMKKEVEYLVKNGLAIQSCSPWSSPCLLDMKADGSPRFCTDFRKVNAVTVLDAHPLPLIEDCIDEIGPAKFVTKLDMLKGYWQVPLTQQASDISAFVTPDCFLQYTVMPFGLCNAPATFQRLVNRVLGDVSNCRVYLDDIVVYSSDWSTHLSVLLEVFKRLSAASLTLNLSKCEFGKGTIVYLGQQVGGGKVCPVDAKVKVISDFPVPSSRRELRRFLGMAGFYRRFCKNFSTVAAPLTTLTSPSTPFIWSDECQHAFEHLKGLLSCSPVLSAPNFSLPFKLDIDASAVGVGAVLLQDDKDGIEHPVSYFSRKFNLHQGCTIKIKDLCGGL